MQQPATPKIRVTINPFKCVGSTMCIQSAPLAFKLNDRKQSMVTDSSAETIAKLREAAEQCPMSAIRIEDAETGKVIFPD